MKIRIEIDGMQDAIRALERISIALETLCVPPSKKTDEKEKKTGDLFMESLEDKPVYTGKSWRNGVSVSYIWNKNRKDHLTFVQIKEAIKKTGAKNWNKASSETCQMYLSKEDGRKVIAYCKEKGYIKTDND